LVGAGSGMATASVLFAALCGNPPQVRADGARIAAPHHILAHEEFT
jgi:hypothetical protein